MLEDITTKIVDKIPSENTRTSQANEILENTENRDLQQASLMGPQNNFNYKNPRSWVEAICVIGFTFNILIIPILNSVLSIWDIRLAPIGDVTTDILMAMLGLGGYRLAEKKIGRN